ncbi:hypothetical protein [Streptococcus dysgalactiae]|uniref:hypothetical protein n=1 Tax=Streptococcus dysgalactiae TaxID=1334 RepID=UPI0010CAAF21|nr:hypothetical protein [Streptococcus dysgalactiae]VTT13749.1 Uncharacterised protein [Streptococcus dysgalactiae subsp. equisimilis]
MSNILEFSFIHGNVMEGFRKSNDFILKHKESLNSLSDDLWSHNPFMNNIYHLSSPTSKILGRYFCNVLASLIIEIFEEKVTEIHIVVGKNKELDKYSTLIIDILKKIFNISIFYKKSKVDIFNPRIDELSVKKCIKRGLYDSFEEDDSDLSWIYTYNKSLFYKEIVPLNLLKRKYLESENKHTLWVLNKSIINQTIRRGKQQMSREFIELLKTNKVSDFDFINSYSFYLLVFSSKDDCIKYLEKKINVDRFLSRNDIDFEENLVMKNYATLLPNDNNLKKVIMGRCLSNTPQDVDLWLSWFEMCESCTKITKSLEIFQSGYSDLRFLKNLKFEQLTREEKIRAIILCNTDTNKKLASLLTNSLTDKLLKDKLEIMVKNYNFNCYLEGTIRP